MKVRSPHATTRRVVEQLEHGCVPWLASMHESLRHTPEAWALRARYASPLAACQGLLARSTATVVWAEVSDYDPALDRMALPDLSTLFSGDWCTLVLHNLVHAAWHPRRLNSPPLTLCHPFSTAALTAALGANYLAGVVGIATEPEPPTDAYLQGWVDALQRDPRMLPAAVEGAACAVTYLLKR
jgi:antirestriction protein ArdC